jgi:transposase
MTITTVGIDLAKNVFAVHGVDQNGKAVLVKPKVSRAALPELIAGLPPCVIGMEAARVPTIGQDYSGSMVMMSG